ncbi:hypothetical protein PF010_g10347 [Phytophthora fragariae]|uniref:Uncharacterized protein n=1 Tax=Phytophthora fragariae TaxID=53985 RepID=A0A6G0P1Y0_9STRA|nr:hypothetical protein PF010_g10347 [Phytophthora fragariae]KAE9231924.1 hypothetical protein PF004_g10081 [Phytophthora fragariae]
MQDPARVTDDVTLALRGERIPLRNAVSSVYNRSRQELLVATPAALYLYGKMMTAGGDLLATLAAEENVYFQFVVHLPWLDAYSVVVSHASGKIEHRIVSSDLKTSLTSHTLLETEGQFYTALANPHRRELITADTDGGIKVWALRVISNAQNNGGFKGVLRVHTAANSTKKPYYRHLHMSFDGQKIFAATSTKVYVFDAASCSRLPCCLREERRTIFSMDCGNKDNSVFLVFRMNMRKICKYSFVVKKGTPQFRKVGEYEHDQELAAFIENDHGTGNGVVMVDTYARFTTTEIIDSIRSGSDTTPQVRRSLSAVTLPYNPPSERYNALHVDTFGGDRNFVFAVWSTGFCIVELFFSDAQGRLLCDAFNGEYLKRLDDVSGGGIISIYEPLPSAQVVMFEEGDANFRFAALPVVPDPNIAEGEAEKSLPIVDYVVAADAVIALWPHGLVEKHNLSDNRVFTIAQPFESVATTATTMISLSFNRVDCVAVGDSTGAIYVFPLFNSDGVCHGMITRKQAHANDGVSALLDLDNGKPTSIETGHSLLSVSRGGEVKRWLIRRATQSAVHDAGPDFEWELVVCFRTYSPDVSTATFEFPEFVFCGFDGGSVECWRLPSSSENSSSKGLRRQAQVAGRISVVKRALHTIDLHLAPVRCILCESGSGELVTASSQPVADHFSWVFSYDEDATILVWCFSLDFFFPHRRIKVHECIKGIYISPANGCLNLFAYIDRCIDRIDHLGSGDKEAVRERLQRGRELSAQRDLRKLEDGDGQTKREEGRRVSTASGLRSRLAVPTSYDQSSFGVPSVRINITLPAVEQKVKAVRKTSAGTSPVKPVVEEVKLVQSQPVDKPAIDKTVDTKEVKVTREEKILRNVLSASPTRILDRPPSKAKPRSPVLRRNHLSQSLRSPQRKKRSKKKSPKKNNVRDANAGFLPGQNSLPSSFQQTKPRVYRKAVNPLDSLSSQARCAVITAGGACSSSSSSSEEEGEPVSTDLAKHLVRSVSAMTLDFGLQEKVSVVSLVEDEDESILLLDYRPGSRRSRSRKSRQSIDEDKHEIPETSFEIPFLPWDRMSERDRRVELMAASKSKCIQEDAERDEVVVPPVDDFESVEISVQLGIRSFTRWFAATHRHRQRIRERFLAEELLFAAVDPIVHQKLADVGLSPPPTQQIGLATSTAWQEFVSWYCLGLTTRHQTIPPEVLQRERLKSRTEYLELRLRMVAQSELEVQEEEERAGPCEEESEPPQRVYIFEHFVKRSLSDKDNPTSWENTSPENRQKEITLVLMDPAVQIAAMRNDIELPDVSGSCMEDFDMLQLAGKFIPWWRATRNVHRRDFLKREVHEASTSKAILELLSKEQHLDGETIDRNQVIKDFFESYFRSDKARHTFLKKKLFYLKRKSRIASVARYGKLPAPLVVETLPLPLVTSFEFIEREIVEEVETEEFIEPGEEEEEPVEPEHVAVVEQPKVASIDDQREQEEEELRRREGEKAKITLELIYMAREDALSREYNNSFVESDEEVEEPSLVMPKRTDFSRSYFFGNLPMHYRKVASSGWRAGSGVDNGDEEHEEEEQLERERERQRLLDEQEAERLLELERQAERARIEKEREEKAFQFRRVRQAELKKVLVHQAELEAQRKAELEVSREMMEQNFMQREDELSCWNRDQLLRDQIGMQLEDQLAFQVRKELREAAAARMRMLLHEQACTSAEDKRSSLVGKELKALEHQRAVRRAFLSEIYTPFHPFYNDSAEASESFLPRIQWRLEQEQQRRTPVKPAVGYTIPLQDALVLDELDQDPYLARDSRKFKLLMGLPLRTPSSQKRPRIPTADAIIAMQQQQRQLDIDEERHESPVGTGKCAPLPHKVRPHSRTKNTGERSRLPDIMPKTRSVSSLTDLKEVCRKQDPESPTKRKPTKSNQQQPQNQQNQSLPFFRGNMLVQGHGQPRSKDYAY